MVMDFTHASVACVVSPGEWVPTSTVEWPSLGLAALAVDNHDVRPLVEGRRRQARVVSRAGNGCHSATEAGVVQDDAAVIAAVVRANEPATAVGDREQFEPDRDGAIGHAGWVDVDGQGRRFSATNAQCFDAVDDSDGCAALQCVPALVGGIIEIHFKRRRWQPGGRCHGAAAAANGFVVEADAADRPWPSVVTALPVCTSVVIEVVPPTEPACRGERAINVQRRRHEVDRAA
eukprot:scaffold88995_cov74-Phaeocystis_antarctica.AAC.1